LEFKLKENEAIIKTLEKDWKVVRHGKEFEWSKAFFRFELLREPVLTNQRLILRKNNELEYEIPLSNIDSIERISPFFGNPYIKVALSDGEIFSLAFVLPSIGAIYKKFFGFGPAILSKQRKIMDEWTEAIKQAQESAR